MKMTRKSFLFGVAATAASARGGARDGLPDWANAQIDEAVARYRAWKGADETVAFTFVTDVHSRLTETAAPIDFANSRHHVLFTQALADRAGCDFLVDGGDHDFENACKSDEEALKRMAVSEGVYRDYAAKPVLFCLGNHDHGPALGRTTRPISSARFGDTFNGLAERHGFKLVFGENRSWGSFDVPGKRFRAIFCNTSDCAYYGLSQGQIDFVAQALASMPADWTAAAFGHYCVFDEIGHWKQYQNAKGIPGRQAFMATLEAFAKERPNALTGYFCGDSHFDNEMELRGVNWTISQGYGGVNRANKPWGARTTPFDRARQMLFELVAVKPARGEFRLFRVGAGGAACDRTCHYFNKS
ncbi:MAG: metallophosphoesterase family protein [Kiritimatiellia bacterium]